MLSSGGEGGIDGETKTHTLAHTNTNQFNRHFQAHPQQTSISQVQCPEVQVHQNIDKSLQMYEACQ